MRSFTGMGRITGMDYRNGLSYAELGTSNVLYMLRILYNSDRESFVLEIGSLRYHKIYFQIPTLVVGGCVCVWWGGGLLVQKFLG